MKKILHISTIDQGGAANICIHLQKKLISDRNKSNIIVLKKTSFHENIEQYYDRKSNSFISQKFYHYQSYLYPWIFNKLLKDQPKDHEAFTFPFSFFDLTKHPLYKEADLLHFHYVSYLINWNSFFSNNTKPIVWTLHDMNTFTGGCHHSENCTGFTENCKCCPQLEHTYIRNFAQKMLTLKLKKLCGDITFISPSRWHQLLAKQSTLLKGKDIRFIPNGVNLDIFRNKGKNLCRTNLELPLDKKIILFIVDDFARKNKGYELFLFSLDHLKDRDNMIFIFIGNNLKTKPPLKNLIYFPFIRSPHELAEMYSLADVTVVPSKFETSSLIALESMACRTPVVAYNAAGQKERIVHKIDGYLAEPYSPESFAEGIEYCLSEENHSRLAQNCLKKVVSYYSFDIMYEAYMSVYKEKMV